jgi:hypothetical protein
MNEKCNFFVAGMHVQAEKFNTVTNGHVAFFQARTVA